MRVRGIIKKLRQKKVPEAILSKFEAVMNEDLNENEIEYKIIALMDEHLTEEQRILSWERGGSCTGGGRNREAKTFAKEHGDKSLAEKVELLNNTRFLSNIKMTGPTSFSAISACHCTSLRPEKFTTSRTFYGCNASSAIYNYQIALGVPLKLISYEAAPAAPGGKRACLFTFEVEPGK